VGQQVLKVVSDGDGDGGGVMMVNDLIHFAVVGPVEMYDGNDLAVGKNSLWVVVVIEVSAVELEMISHHTNVVELTEQELLAYMQVAVEVDLLVILVDDDNEYVNAHGVHGFDDLSVLADNDDDDAHVNLKDDCDGDGVMVNVMD
jgi:hypothetical protein